MKKQTLRRVATTPKTYVVDLDKAPKDRWAFLASDPMFANYKQNLIGYLAKFIPKFLLPVIAGIAKGLQGKYYPAYAEEMTGLAKALGVSVGDIVVVNLIYQLEDIGVKCSLSNTTGPCPKKIASPGICSGILIDSHDDGGAQVWQGRNLDWNLDESLLKYVIRVDYQRNGVTVFSGVQIAGEVGVLHGMRLGGFSIQMNARQTGGNVLENLLEQIVMGAKTPSHVMRYALEHSMNFTAADTLLSTEKLANPVYYIMAGSGHAEGVIISRDRTHLLDAWHLYENSTKDTKNINIQPGWLRVQTNYDHWEAAPSYDNRRDPGVKHVQQYCNETVDQTSVKKVMTTWPTMNHHTDVTSIMCPATGYFDVTVWSTPSQSVLI